MNTRFFRLRRTLRVALWRVVGSGVAMAVAQSALGAEAEVQAHWQDYQVSFGYSSLNTLYSCNGIEDRIEDLLRQLGARKDARASAAGCGGDQVSPMISVRIRAALPVAGAASQGGETFTAQHKSVQLKTKSNGAVGSGDCELLEQIRGRLLPELKLKSTGDDLRCIPGQPSIGVGTLNVAALLQVSPKEPVK